MQKGKKIIDRFDDMKNINSDGKEISSIYPLIVGILNISDIIFL